MSLNVKKIKGDSKFERPPALEAGAYPARVVQIVGLGLQEQRPYKGEAKSPKQELYVTYEHADEFLLDEDGNDIEDKPRWTSETFPLNSLNSDRAKSTARYMALDPSLDHDGDFTALVGTPCIVTLSADPSKKDPTVVYNNVRAVNSMRAKDQSKAPELVNPPKVFDFYEPDVEVFLSFPEWLQDKIKSNLDFPGSDLANLLGDVSEEKESDSSESDDEGDDSDW